MKTLYIILLGTILTLFPHISYAYEYPVKDSDANLVGHVVDKHTKEHLPYVTISLKGTTIGTTTDATGHYYLVNLPEGEFTVEVSSVGYKSVRRDVKLKKGKTQEIKFEIEEDMISLEGVVVSANRSETTRRMAPTLVNVMNMKTFEYTNSSTLSQGLNFQPGVRVENNCQNCGFQQVRINGLDGPYTQILIDSRPIFSALSGVYGLEQIPANMIDRVEVMRGGGSALFGSSAIAGTINIITKEPTRNSAQISHTLTGIGDGSAFDNNTTLNASLITDDHKMGIAVFGQNRERAGYDHDGDGYTELPELKNQTVGMRSYIKTSDYSKLSFEYHHLQEFRRGGDMLDRPAHEANIAEQIKHNINTGGVKFDYFTPNEKHRLSVYTSAQHVDRDSYYGGAILNEDEPGKALKAYGASKNLTLVAGSQYIYSADKCWFMPADFTAGLEYTHDNLKDTQWGYERYIKQKVNIGSFFAQNEWKNEQWGILIGGRLDKHSMLKNPIFSPRANLRFNPTENINLRASYSFGFRAPQAFDEDLHIENVGGNVSMIQLADDLKEEKSQSVSVSADMYHSWGDWQGNLLVEGFFTTINDVFALTELGVVDGVLHLERGNEKGANVYGMTLEGKIAWRNKWQMQAGFTLQKAEYKEARAWGKNVAEEKRMFRTPDAYGYFTMTYTPIKPLNISLSGTYTGSMLVEHHAGYIETNRTEKTKSFMDLGIKASYDFSFYKGTTLQLNAGLQNILNAYQNDFDKGANRDSGYIYGPGMPRSFFAGVKLSY